VEGIKLESGKYYRARGGKKAFCTFVGTDPFGNQKVALIIFEEEPQSVRYHWQDGSWSSLQESKLDLIAEWKEPKRIKGCMNVYPTAMHQKDGSYFMTGIWETREKADLRD
jgi:hypothetical protein